MPNYTRLRATAERLIARSGRDVVVRKVSLGADLWDPVPANSDFAAKAVDTNIVSRDRADAPDNSVTRTMYVSTSVGVEISETDKIVIDGGEFGISSVEALDPGGTVLLWIVNLES